MSVTGSLLCLKGFAALSVLSVCNSHAVGFSSAISTNSRFRILLLMASGSGKVVVVIVVG